MLNKLLANKKIVFITIALLLAVCGGVVIIMTSGSKGTGGKNTNIKTEQSKGEVDSQDDKKDTDSSDNDDSSVLQVLEPDEVKIRLMHQVLGIIRQIREHRVVTRTRQTTKNRKKTKISWRMISLGEIFIKYL